MLAEETIKLKRFCQEIINKPRPMEDQPHAREGVFLWCEDWEIIEILKYFFNGKEGYFGDPPPNRLKNNPLWSKEKIEEKALNLMEAYKDADGIIEYFRANRASRVG